MAGLVLKGNLSINSVDVSDQVSAFTISGTRDQVEVPATFGARKSFKAGADMYEITIDYLQGSDTTDLSMIFFDALADSDGTITYSGTPYSDSPASTSNPIYDGTAVVTAAALGGEADTLGTDSVTFPCTDRPTKTTV
jgi:hypothetical protein